MEQEKTQRMIQIILIQQQQEFLSPSHSASPVVWAALFCREFRDSELR